MEPRRVWSLLPCLASTFLFWSIGWASENRVIDSGDPLKASGEPNCAEVVDMGPDHIKLPDARIDTPSLKGGVGRRGSSVRSRTGLKEPIWKGLERLGEDERANARIGLDLPKDASPEARAHACRVEETWNSGRHEEALQFFRSLGELMDLGKVALGLSWRKPVRLGGADWGNDVQVSGRTGIYEVVLDFHDSTGHLFVGLLYPESPQWRWSVNFSSDGGATWAETYEWWSSQTIFDISGVVLTDYFYVGYADSVNPTSARVRRFNVSDGSVDNGYGWVEVFDLGTVLREIGLASNADYYDNRIYYLAILQDNSLQYYWDSTTATSWSPIDPGISNADRGLDVCTNEGFVDYFLWVSFIGTDDSLYVAGKSSVWQDFGNLDWASSLALFSSVGAYHDTVISVFEHNGQNNGWAKYRISYDAGSTWLWGMWGDTLQDGWTPNVTSRQGDGMGGVYQQGDGTSPDDAVFSWRQYAPPPPDWTTPVDLDDHGTDVWQRPAIEWLESGVYGVVYVQDPDGHAYFDRSDWFGVEEQETGTRHQAPVTSLHQNCPNPFSRSTTISYFLPSAVGGQPSAVSLRIHDLSGRLVISLVDRTQDPGTYLVGWDGRDQRGSEVPGGVYFYTLKTGDFKSTGKAVLLR